MGTGSLRTPGGKCCGTVSAGAWPPRCWRSGTGLWGSGRRYVMCCPKPANSGAPFHKMGNVLSALSKSVRGGAKVAMRQIMEAQDVDHARRAAKLFIADYGAKWPKAARKIEDDLDVLLEFYNFPAR